MKAMKKALALLLCFVMTIGIFSVANITFEDLADLFAPKAKAATNPNKTIDAITQEWVVSDGTVLGVSDRDIFYEVYANDYFDGHSEPTDLVIPGLGSSSNYTPQGMTYWEAKNWILMSAYDDAVGSTGRPSCIYAIDVASGEFVALFYIYNSNNTANTSHGGGIAVSEHNFYFADSGSNVSYVPLSELDVAEDTCKNITLKGTLSFSSELAGAPTSYCCYDDGVLWVGNFYLDSESSYNTPANASHNSMLLGYKLEGDSSQEEWDYLCGKYKNVLNVVTASGTGSNSGANLTWNAFKNGESVDITGSITAPTAYVGEFCPTFGSLTLTEGKDYIIEFISTNNQSDLYIFSPGGKHTNVRQSSQTTITKLDDGRYHYRMFFTAGLKPANADSSWPATQSTDGSFTGTYSVRFDQDAISAGEARDFAMTDIRVTEANPNLLKLKHASLTGDLAYTITTNTNGSYNITGSATNSTASEKELTSKYATCDLVEGETYTLSYTSTDNLTDAYIWAPSASGYTHMRLVPQRGTKLADGTYYYETTFTAGKSINPNGGGDYTWPAEQSTDGSFTGTYTLRFDQDSIPANTTRNFTISNISLKKTDSSRPSDRIHFVGTAGYPTYVVAFPNTYTTTIKNGNQGANASHNFNRIQYAMVDNGRIYVSRSWSRNMTSDNYISELDIIDISLDVPGTYSLTVGSVTRNDCYQITSGSINQFHAPSMLEALCVVDDYLYMFTESAAYYYREYNGRDGNISSQPIDVVWKLDQYAVLGQDRKETVGGNNTRSTAGYVDSYERINSLEELNYNDNYMIVYESDTKAANGNKILYALDSYGGFKDGLVPKNSAGTQANTADSLGMDGHPISKYALEGDVLKLNDVVADDKDSLHWNLIGADTGAFRIENNDSYYGDYKNLYFGSRLMYMMNSKGTTSKLDHIKIKDNGDSTFSFYYDGDADYYLWCNDGSIPAYTQAYNKIYNNTYAFGGDNPETTDVESGGVKAYAGQVEKAGTFHTDAFAKKTANDSGNKTGEAVNEKYTKFSIYRRADDLSSTGKSGLSTDLNAELQADGTYTITLESYSTGQTITKKSTDGKPIDFVFVLDTSGSMNTNYDVPYMGRSDNPEPYSYNLANKENGRALKYGGAYYYFDRYKSGDYSNAAIKVGSDYYSIGANSSFFKGGDAGSKGIKNQDYGFAGGFYWVNRQGDKNRLEAMKQSTLDFIQQIEDHAEKTGLQHRIAIVQYGSTSYLGGRTGEDENFNNTGLYATTTGITMTNFGTLCTDKTARTFTGYGNNVSVYENAFYPASHDNLEQIVSSISVSGDPDTFVEHGLEMALNVICDQMSTYNTSGDRVGNRVYSGTNADTKALVINITDGMPGYGKDDGDAAYCSARGALEKAGKIKAEGAEIYTIQMGSDESSDGLQNSNFLKAISSNYTGGYATSKYESSSNTFNMGTTVSDGYYLQRTFSGELELDGFFDHLSQAGEGNILEVETVTLGSDSITLQSLGDTFKLTDASVATAKTSNIYYDSLGRIYEEEPETASYSITKNVSANTVQLTGFDYSSEYVADGNEGKKLYLQIDGVLLNPNKEHGLNVPISNEAKTAIYANSAAVSSGTATQYFPQVYFEVPTYNYIYDYGVQMNNTSIYGTPLSFDTVPDKQSTYSTGVNIDGDAAISYNGTNVVSNIAPDCNGIRESFVLVQKPAGGYYWARVNMIPASNVYFEETYIVNIASDNEDWSSIGTSAGIIQTLSSSSDVYGYDAAYSTNRTYSNGTAKTVTVDSSNKRSDTQTVTLTGTGFDLISACGANTGMQTVTVKQGSTVKKVYIVDTFYNDTYGTLAQVPVVHYEGDYGTYTVETTAVYMKSAGAVTNATVSTQAVEGTELETQSAPVDELTAAELLAQVGMDDLANADVELVWMDDDSIFNGGAGVQGEVLATQAGETTSVSLVNYIDGIRVYNPVPAANQSSYISSESDANYYNVINSLASSSDIISGNNATSFIGYVEKVLSGSINFSDYAKSNAPKNEVYLTSDGESALTFKVKLDNSSSRVMLGMRAVHGTPAIVINGNAITANGSAISSATEMYYDITEAIQDHIADGYATITIKNTAANSILAVNNVKVVNGSVAALASDDILEVASLMTMAVTRTIDVNSAAPVDYSVAYPGNTPVNTIPNPDPDLDPVGEYVITTPENNADDDNAAQSSILEKIAELLKNLLAKIISFIKSIFSMIPFFKEV